jgi:hypothetical protein
MKVTRTITFSTDNYDVMERQCRNSGPDGTYEFPSGLILTIATIEQDIPNSIQESLQFNNSSWAIPTQYMKKDG